VNSNQKYNLIVILGPTASGKTSVAAHLAKEVEGEIISADSRQIYKDLNLGTGKDYDDYTVDGFKVPYHLIDIKPAGYQYNIYEYQKDFLLVFEEIKQKNKWPVLCGGSGLYIETVIQGHRLIQVPVNEELRSQLELKSLEELTQILAQYQRLHNTTDCDTKKRAVRAIEIAVYCKEHNPKFDDYPQINPLLVGVRYPREIERERITARLKQRLEQGMIQEVENLLKTGLSPDQLLYYGLEYKYLTLYLTGQIKYTEMFNQLNTAIHQFAKRQMTWYRRMERNGYEIHWLDGALPMNEKIEKIKEWMR
jgi:tRNA dimethylallyltransferase